LIINLNEMPGFVRFEMEKLGEMIAPKLKKANQYAFWSKPLIFVAALNLFLLLLVMPAEDRSIPLLLFCAVAGAFGMALSQEARVLRKEITKLSFSYMKKRIEKSSIVPDPVKKRYAALIEKEPTNIFLHFIHFLEEEQNRKKEIW
jgi:hypothetical protein